METINENKDSIFQTINGIGRKLKSSKLEVDMVKSLTPELDQVAKYLDVNFQQALIFTILFRLNCNDGHSGFDFSDVSKYLQVELVELLIFQKDVDILSEMNLLGKVRNRSNSKIKLMNFNYHIPSKLLDAILMNELKPDLSTIDEMDIFQFVNKVSESIRIRKFEKSDTIFLVEIIENLEDKYQDLNLLKRISNFNLDISDRIIFYEMCNDLLISGCTGLALTMDDIFSCTQMRLSKSQEIMNETNSLFELELIEFSGGNIFSEANVKLTDKGMELFLEENVNLFLSKSKPSNLITPDKIVSKDLFYDEELNRQISVISHFLEQDRFEDIQNRLIERSLPKGVSIVLYGKSGTGKTETVFQLAKQSGRSIIKVDLSKSKSMWLGESEKKIKKVFDDYKKLCSTETPTPILLFNEADGIFGQRKIGSSSNVTQTENTMQNIILDELENLEGVLIATTNLSQNFDSAFERRFLFKVEFKEMTIEVKRKIWENKLPWLTQQESERLALNYSFSGGEIENIVRKVTINEVLTGTTPDLQQLVQYCNCEKFSGRGGFKVGY